MASASINPDHTLGELSFPNPNPELSYPDILLQFSCSSRSMGSCGSKVDSERSSTDTVISIFERESSEGVKKAGLQKGNIGGDGSPPPTAPVRKALSYGGYLNKELTDVEKQESDSKVRKKKKKAAAKGLAGAKGSAKKESSSVRQKRKRATRSGTLNHRCCTGLLACVYLADKMRFAARCVFARRVFMFVMRAYWRTLL